MTHHSAYSLLAAALLAIPPTAWSADTATINCVSLNGGFRIDGGEITILEQGETLEVAVAPDGSLLELWSCGWPDVGCQMLPYLLLPGTEWNIDSFCDVRIVLQEVNDCDYLMLLNCPPSDDPQSFADGLDVQINGYTGSATCPPVAGIHWDWGDGASGASWFPAAHSYAETGTYTVCAASYDATGIGLLASANCQVSVVSGRKLTCEGFAPPMSDFPVSFKRNHAIPLRAELFEEDGYEVTGTDLATPPIVTVWFDALGNEDPPVSLADVPHSGDGDPGNQFYFTDSDLWQFILSTHGYTAAGAYVATIESGDPSEYVIDPACVTEFIVE